MRSAPQIIIMGGNSTASGGGGGGGPANAETTTWVNAVVGDGGSVSAGRQTTVDTLITSLKSASVWTLLDRLWLLAAENSQSALRDLVTTEKATLGNTPTFTIDRGYTGNASNQTIITTYTPSAGPHLSQNSAHIGVYSLTNASTGNGQFGCGTTPYLQVAAINTGVNIGIRVTGGASASLDSGDTVPTHVCAMRRNDSANIRMSVNGAASSSAAAASAAVNTDPLVFFKSNNLFSNPQVAAGHVGGALDDTQNSALYAALHTYMIAVGADT